MTESLKRNLKLGESLVRVKNPHDRKKIEDSFKAAPSFLRALADRLEINLESKVKDSEGLQQYLNTNWTLYQADNRGYRRALRDVLSMFVEYK